MLNKIEKSCVISVKNVDTTDSVGQEYKHIGEDGNDRWFKSVIMPLCDGKGKELDTVIVNCDITKMKYFEELSITDALTGLYNRRHFNDIFKREMSRAIREKGKLSFLILDIDYFKKYNDSYGHDAGDKALIAVAKAIEISINRGSDFAFRLGGEEFGVLFCNTDIDGSLLLAERIRKNVEELKIEHTNSLVSKYISVSIGLLVVDFVQENVDEHGFYTMADDALYQAKESGRNKVVMYENDEVEFF